VKKPWRWEEKLSKWGLTWMKLMNNGSNGPMLMRMDLEMFGQVCYCSVDKCLFSFHLTKSQ
jgi:hypothetical protein